MNKECFDCKIVLTLNGKNFPYLPSKNTFSNRCKKCHSVYIDKFLLSERDRKNKIKKAQKLRNKCLKAKTRKLRIKTIESEYLDKKRNEAKRGHSFLLTIEEFQKLKEKTHCYYCGEKFFKPQSGICGKGMTIDRVDNNVCYIGGNCVSCCRWCNATKGQKTLLDFVKTIKKKQKKIKQELILINSKIDTIQNNIDVYLKDNQ